MRIIQTVAVIVLVLIWSAAHAERKAKDLICHVGNEEGPGGETYLDDPTCIPSDFNNYFCPDAGKIDLIVVAKSSMHLNNPSHMYDGISDYRPEDIGASGYGTEDTDGDGIDEGCEPVACPCWAENDLQAVTAANQSGDFSCDSTGIPLAEGAFIQNTKGSTPGVEGGFAACLGNTFCADGPDNLCVTRDLSVYLDGISEMEASNCIAQIERRCAAIGTPIPRPGCNDRESCTVFVTSIQNLTGDLVSRATALGITPVDGLDAGDRICQKLANDAGIGGTRMYLAWLSDSSESPSTRFPTQATVPYRRTDGVLIADGWSDLTDGSIAATITFDENGVQRSTGGAYSPWTGTEADGTADAGARFCNDWTSDDVADQGFTGRWANTNAAWTAAGPRQCNRQRSPTETRIDNTNILCFEQ